MHKFITFQFNLASPDGEVSPRMGATDGDQKNGGVLSPGGLIT